MKDIIEKFEKSFVDWEKKMNEDEWYFVKLEDELVDDLTKEEAFKKTSEVLQLILKYDNSTLRIEIFNLTLMLMNFVNTTELTPKMKNVISKIENIYPNLSDNSKDSFRIIKKFYRLK